MCLGRLRAAGQDHQNLRRLLREHHALPLVRSQVCIRQHKCVSIRQHTSAYVSIRQRRHIRGRVSERESESEKPEKETETRQRESARERKRETEREREKPCASTHKSDEVDRGEKGDGERRESRQKRDRKTEGGCSCFTTASLLRYYCFTTSLAGEVGMRCRGVLDRE